MSFWKILGLVVSGAGTFASILGVFFGLYARQNGRATREFIAAQNKDMREFIAAQTRDMQEFLARVLERLGDRISQEGEKPGRRFASCSALPAHLLPLGSCRAAVIAWHGSASA